MEDRVMLITGASTGIGAVTAQKAVEQGLRVVLAARSEDRLRDLAAKLGGEEKALAVRCDVTEWEDLTNVVARTHDHFGKLDVVFANAGFGAPNGFAASTPDHWREMILTNVYGVAITIRASLDAIKQAKGHFLITGSVAGRRALAGSLYSATKWAVTGMGEALRQDLIDTGVRVTLLEPGMVQTPFFDDPLPIEALQAEDIANAVLYAISQPARVNVNEILIRPTAQKR